MRKGFDIGLVGFGLASYAAMLDGLLTASVMKIIIAGAFTVTAFAIAMKDDEQFAGLSFSQVFGIFAKAITAIFVVGGVLGRGLANWIGAGFFDRALEFGACYGFIAGTVIMTLGFGCYIIDGFRKNSAAA